MIPRDGIRRTSSHLDDEAFLGKGTYGEVSVREGKAVKKFSKLCHLIQEYMALYYLDKCSHIVHSKGVDFRGGELYMELYDCDLREWLEKERRNNTIEREKIMKIIRDMLTGLVQLHDRGLVHGDLKPGNVLIKYHPFGAVLGDCGFVSIGKYAKIGRTADRYRDPVLVYDSSHDMFSFGICFIELVAGVKTSGHPTYSGIRKIAMEKIKNQLHRKLACDLLSSDRSVRPSARQLLGVLFNESPERWISNEMIVVSSNETHSSKIRSSVHPFFSSLNKQSQNHTVRKQSHVTSIISEILDEERDIRNSMKIIADEFSIHRGIKGYGALLFYINKHNTDRSVYDLYIVVTLMIMSSIFGKSGFREDAVIERCSHRYNMSQMYDVLEKLLSDRTFVNILLAP